MGAQGHRLGHGDRQWPRRGARPAAFLPTVRLGAARWQCRGWGVAGRDGLAHPEEVAEYGFFPPGRLPEPMSEAHRRQVLDALKSPQPERLTVMLPPGAEG